MYLWLIHIVVKQKPTQHCKAIILQLKKKRQKSGKDLDTLSLVMVKGLFLKSESVSRSVVSESLQSHGLYSLLGFPVHGILQARILEWVAIPFSRGLSQPRDQT